MAKQKLEWVTEEKAAELIGLKAPILRRYVIATPQVLEIGYTRATSRKAEPRYNKFDIDRILLQNSRLTNY